MNRRAVIYLACPMTTGGFTHNTRRCLEVADRLFIKGYSPIPPVLTWYWDVVSPKSHEDWLCYDFGIIGVCDGILRISGDSEGADMEMDFAARNGIPVYFSEYDLYRGQSPEVEL